MQRVLAIILCSILAAQVPLEGQQVGQNVQSGAEGQYTLTVRTQLVVETVVVRDKKGQPIEGLTANDFTISEDGVVQKIRFCDYQLLPKSTNPLPPSPSQQPDEIKLYRRLPHTQISTDSQKNPRYQNRRLLALYFDMTAMRPAEQLRALAAAKQFIKTQATVSDMIAIMRYAGAGVEVLQDFTDDRNALLSILEAMIVGEGQVPDDNSNEAGVSDTGAAFGQDDSEFNIFNTNRQLSALQTASNMLAQLSEKKSLIYFASGLRLNGIDNQAQLHATIDSAIRGDVSFWPIDARGLTAQAPLGDATRASPVGSGVFSGASAQAVTANFQQSQDTLYALAQDTGGKALLDYNDLTKGIVEAQRSISSYYVLGYYTTNPAKDGKFRHIKVSLNADGNANLDYRHGYYATKEFSKFTEADKERQLEDALMLEDPVTDLTIAMEINYFQLNRAEYFASIVVKIPGRELALAKRGGAQRTLIDFIGEIKDDFGGRTVTNVRDAVNIKLTNATALELSHRAIEYDTGFTLLPGKYTIKFLARDDETGRIGTYQTTFVIPNLNNEVKRVPISSVVLSSQRIEPKEALYTAATNKGSGRGASPLVQDGKKLVPSVTRVFSRSRDMYIYLEAYAPDTLPNEPLIAFATFYQAQKKLYETQPIVGFGNLNARLRTVPLNLTVPPNRLPIGEYDCQLTVLDPNGHKAAFWQSAIKVVP
jgi:VWFA-related protein